METQKTYLQKKRAFKTNLVHRGPAPGIWKPLTLPAGEEETVYTSDNRQLKTVVLTPENGRNRKNPSIVLFHGGTVLKQEFLDQASRPFLKAGMPVMLPTMRGENGNEGNQELFFGEVEDGVEAIKWFARHPNVDPEKICIFGYSMGGEVSALLSLYEHLPVRFGGSVGAFFGRSDRFGAKSMFNTPVPFDVNDENEKALRTLAGNIHEMKFNHYAYIGKDDQQFDTKEYKKIETANSRLKIEEVEGDHDTSLEYAIEKFLKITVEHFFRG